MRSQKIGFMALFIVGGYYLWRNRFQVQRFLEGQGIDTPLDTMGNLSDTVKSGVAKLKGSIDNVTHTGTSLDSSSSSSSRRAV